MPNYRYNSQDYMRRRGCSQTPPVSVPDNTRPICQNTGHICDELSNMPIAMAYVPWQEWRNIYEAEKGFHYGTIFEELNKPFRGIGGCQNVR